MPEVNVTLSNMTEPGQKFLLDMNYDKTYAWATNCTQSMKGVERGCDLEPSKTILTSDFGTAETNTYEYFTGHSAGGYNFAGWSTSQGVDMKITETQSVTFTDNVEVVDEIFTDSWLYENLNQVNNGAWAIGYGSKFAEQFTFRDTTLISYQSGWIQNQTWAASNTEFVVGIPDITIGYQPWNSSPDQVYLNSTSTRFEFAIDSFEFGQLNYEADVPTSGYFEPIALDTTALVALNARGMALPSEMFETFAVLLNNITSAVCLGDQGGWCYMMQPCENYPELWDLQFKVKFTGAENYVIVPVGSFSFNHASSCFLQIEPLIEGKPMSDQIVFGALFMQNFESQFLFNYTTDAENKTSLLLKPTSTVPLTGMYSGSATYTTGVNPFNPEIPSPSDPSSDSGALVWILVIATLALICLGVAIFYFFKAKAADSKTILNINQNNSAAQGAVVYEQEVAEAEK